MDYPIGHIIVFNHTPYEIVRKVIKFDNIVTYYAVSFLSYRLGCMIGNNMRTSLEILKSNGIEIHGDELEWTEQLHETMQSNNELKSKRIVFDAPSTLLVISGVK